eukprot:SAG31_NODE_2457_length_5661_cov_94.571557_1_plen_326_part_00
MCCRYRVKNQSLGPCPPPGQPPSCPAALGQGPEPGGSSSCSRAPPKAARGRRPKTSGAGWGRELCEASRGANSSSSGRRSGPWPTARRFCGGFVVDGAAELLGRGLRPRRWRDGGRRGGPGVAADAQGGQQHPRRDLRGEHTLRAARHRCCSHRPLPLLRTVSERAANTVPNQRGQHRAVHFDMAGVASSWTGAAASGRLLDCADRQHVRHCGCTARHASVTVAPYARRAHRRDRERQGNGPAGPTVDSRECRSRLAAQPLGARAQEDARSPPWAETRARQGAEALCVLVLKLCGFDHFAIWGSCCYPAFCLRYCYYTKCSGRCP